MRLLAVRQQHVTHRGCQSILAEDLLDGPHVDSQFQQVRSGRVPEHRDGNGLREPRDVPGLDADGARRPGREWTLLGITMEKPGRIVLGQVSIHQARERRRIGNEPRVTDAVLLDVNQLPLGIQVFDAKVNELRGSQGGRVRGHQEHATLELSELSPELKHFLTTEHHG